MAEKYSCTVTNGWKLVADVKNVHIVLHLCVLVATFFWPSHRVSLCLYATTPIVSNAASARSPFLLAIAVLAWDLKHMQGSG